MFDHVLGLGYKLKAVDASFENLHLVLASRDSQSFNRALLLVAPMHRSCVPNYSRRITGHKRFFDNITLKYVSLCCYHRRTFVQRLLSTDSCAESSLFMNHELVNKHRFITFLVRKYCNSMFTPTVTQKSCKLWFCWRIHVGCSMEPRSACCCWQFLLSNAHGQSKRSSNVVKLAADEFLDAMLVESKSSGFKNMQAENNLET